MYNTGNNPIKPLRKEMTCVLRWMWDDCTFLGVFCCIMGKRGYWGCNISGGVVSGDGLGPG